VRACGGPVVCVHTGGRAVCGAPGGAAVKSSLGRAWSATRALPRHAGQVCTWATGESLLLLLHPLLLSQAMVSDHAGQDQWAKLTELALWWCCWMHIWFN
jgi:hypothetical protein